MVFLKLSGDRWREVRSIFYSESKGKEVEAGQDSFGSVLTLYKSILKLDDLDFRIVRQIMSRGSMTERQVAEILQLGAEAVELHLRDLVSRKVLKSSSRNGTRVYSSASERNSDLSSGRFFDGPKIPFVQQLNLLGDVSRMNAFARALDSVVNEQSTVLELGSGTGILSLLAARKAKKVVAVEMDRMLYEVSRTAFRDSEYSDRMTAVQADAMKIQFPFKADVVICEMLDTGLIAESQVNVMNHAVRNLASERYTPVPCRIENFLELIEADYSFYGYTLALPYFEDNNTREPRDFLSDRILYDSVDFREVNGDSVSVDLRVPVSKSGTVNGLRITTRTFLTDDIYADGSSWMNPPLVFPVPAFRAEKGSQVNVHISYEYGKGVENAEVEVSK